MAPRTIDNLGIDASNRYAEDRQKLDQNLLVKEGRNLPLPSQIDVTVPYYPSELDLLFDVTPRQLSWADFYPPTGFVDQKKRLFTHQIIPSLGSEDKKETQVKRIQARVRLTEEKNKKEGREKKKEQQVYGWEDERELQEEENEKKTLLNLLDKIIAFDKFLIDINSRRTQYQKG